MRRNARSGPPSPHRHPAPDAYFGRRGLATVLASNHLPGLRDRLGSTTKRALIDPVGPEERTGNLFEPQDPGRVRSRRQSGEGSSSYTAARRHPATSLATGLAVMAVGTGVAALLARLVRPADT